MDLASVVAALASVGVRVSGSAPNSSVQVASSHACPPGLAGPEPSGTTHDLGQHFQVRGTMVRIPDGQSDPWLQVYANHPAVGDVMGWPREVLPVLQQPLCSLPILAVAVVLDVGTL